MEEKRGGREERGEEKREGGREERGREKESNLDFRREKEDLRIEKERNLNFRRENKSRKMEETEVGITLEAYKEVLQYHDHPVLFMYACNLICWAE